MGTRGRRIGGAPADHNEFECNTEVTPDPTKITIFHITDVANLPSIVADGRLLSDAAMIDAGKQNRKIGYEHIKQRRMSMTVPCCGRAVGDFVPFYYCPRSPMLYTLNQGNVAGCAPGCQRTIVHLASRVSVGIGLGQAWALSDASANGNYPPNFYNNIASFDRIDWPLIRSDSWAGQSGRKQAEFLVADSFSLDGILLIGCHNPDIVGQVAELFAHMPHPPKVEHRPSWYF